MMRINCDLGERGPDHPVDLELMRYIRIANIACGGHAGDAQSVKVFRELAKKYDVQTTAHLSYPDRENFGRLSIQIPYDALSEALDAQIQLVPGIKAVKFHGALYNDSVADRDLANHLGGWLVQHDITEVIAPQDSQLATVCRRKGIALLAEAFAERRYTFNEKTGQLQLVSRAKEYASIHDCETAVAQARMIMAANEVEVVMELDDGEIFKRNMKIFADTICIHSDAFIALDLVKQLAA